MKNINTIFTFTNGIPNSLTAIVDGNQYTADSTHANWNMILDDIRNDDAESFINHIDIRRAFEDYTVGNVKIIGGEVYYGTTRLGGVVVDRIFDFMSNNLPVEPIMLFVNKLFSNPSHRAVNELYRFLEHKNLPITSDGNFRAYKGLLSDFYSITGGNLTLVSGKINAKGQIYNGVGETIECFRHQVDDNKDNTCSTGLHAGSLEYATGFAQGKMVIVEINPADVVSIPSDCEGQKLRTYKYVVVEEYTAPLDNTYIKTNEFNNNPMPSGDSDESGCGSLDDTDGDSDESGCGECDDEGCGSDSDSANCECDGDVDGKSYRNGYDQGYADGFEAAGFDLEDELVNYSPDDTDAFAEGYQKGYDNGVKDRE
jgi:hypothetical protein